MLIKVSEQFNVEQPTGTARNGNINEDIECYKIRQIKFTLQFKLWYFIDNEGKDYRDKTCSWI
jgi:CRISPR/Cas system CSM-associated protein Csm4 (group 5 of RAMP superfamily)